MTCSNLDFILSTFVDNSQYGLYHRIKYLSNENSSLSINLTRRVCYAIEIHLFSLHQSSYFEYFCLSTKLLKSQTQICVHVSGEKLRFENYVVHLVKGFDKSFFCLLLRRHLQEWLMFVLKLYKLYILIID